jgi:hypothetical protein
VSVATDFGVNLSVADPGGFPAGIPDITVNMVLNNRYVELISEGFDMAIRVGELEDSSLRARKLTETTKRMIGAPGYFQKFGRPQKIDDLNDHKLLHYSNQANGNVWKITAPSGEKRQVRSVGWLTVNDGQSLLNAAISGLGIAYLPSFLYADAMRQGLVEEAIPGLPVEILGIYAVYPPGRFTQPKVRAFIDFPGAALYRQGPRQLVTDHFGSGSLTLGRSTGRSDDHFDPSVFLSPLFGLIGRTRGQEAHALGRDPGGVHGKAVDQNLGHGLGPAFRQGGVGGQAARRIGVPDQRDGAVRVRLQPGGHGGKRGIVAIGQGRGPAGEDQIVQHRRADLVQRAAMAEDGCASPTARGVPSSSSVTGGFDRGHRQGRVR